MPSDVPMRWLRADSRESTQRWFKRGSHEMRGLRTPRGQKPASSNACSHWACSEHGTSERENARGLAKIMKSSLYTGWKAMVRVSIAREFMRMQGQVPCLEGEEWRSVPEYEHLYAVSSLGRVWRYRAACLCRLGSRQRYASVTLQKDGVKTSQNVHVLVLLAFVGPRPDGYEGCHFNDVKRDNCLTNLRWDTSKANHADRRRNRRGVP